MTVKTSNRWRLVKYRKIPWGSLCDACMHVVFGGKTFEPKVDRIHNEYGSVYYPRDDGTGLTVGQQLLTTTTIYMSSLPHEKLGDYDLEVCQADWCRAKCLVTLRARWWSSNIIFSMNYKRKHKQARDRAVCLDGYYVICLANLHNIYTHRLGYHEFNLFMISLAHTTMPYRWQIRLFDEPTIWQPGVLVPHHPFAQRWPSLHFSASDCLPLWLTTILYNIRSCLKRITRPLPGNHSNASQVVSHWNRAIVSKNKHIIIGIRKTVKHVGLFCRRMLAYFCNICKYNLQHWWMPNGLQCNSWVYAIWCRYIRILLTVIYEKRMYC